MNLHFSLLVSFFTQMIYEQVHMRTRKDITCYVVVIYQYNIV